METDRFVSFALPCEPDKCRKRKPHQRKQSKSAGDKQLRDPGTVRGLILQTISDKSNEDSVQLMMFRDIFKDYTLTDIDIIVINSSLSLL